MFTSSQELNNYPLSFFTSCGYTKDKSVLIFIFFIFLSSFLLQNPQPVRCGFCHMCKKSKMVKEIPIASGQSANSAGDFHLERPYACRAIFSASSVRYIQRSVFSSSCCSRAACSAIRSWSFSKSAPERSCCFLFSSSCASRAAMSPSMVSYSRCSLKENFSFRALGFSVSFGAFFSCFGLSRRDSRWSE